MNIKRMTVSFLGSLLILFCCTGFSAFAETSLPEGAVKGLPERLAALDDEGNAVNSETGEYFFRVENMKFGETYSKNVQLMNLREDKSYHIYFYVEPLFKDGEIDLEKGCECRFYLDGNEIYKGSVNGDGNIDLTEQHFDCGYYSPGESHTLRCEVIWNDLDVLKNVDYGHRLIDKDGEHVLVGPSGDGYVEGEIEFKWIFYAQVDPDESIPDESTPDESSTDESASDESFVEESTPDSQADSSESSSSGSGKTGDGGGTPFTGMFGSTAFWLVSIGSLSVMVLTMLLMVRNKKKKNEKSK